VFLGALVAPAAREISLTPPRGREVLAVVVLVAGAVGILADVRFVAADVSSVRSHLQPSAALQLRDAERAARWDPWISVYRDNAADLRLQEFVQQRDAYLGSGNNAAALQAASESFDRARTALEDATAYTPTEMDHYNKLATLYFYATFLDPVNLDRIIDTARQGLLVAPTSVDLRVMAASAYATKGDFASAEPLAREATELDPTNAGAFVLLGQIYASLGDADAARAALGQALALDPNNAKAQQLLQSLTATSTP
jgi:tetratricopeptide (TPR) repeat protein